MRYLCICMFLALSSCSFVKTERSNTEFNKKLVIQFYESALFQRNTDAIDEYIGEKYIQHNPNVADGKEALRTLIKSMPKRLKSDGPPGEIVRAIAENDLVVLHVRQYGWPGPNGGALVDIFRVEKGKIVEHWDVIQAVPDISKNNNTMF